METQNSHLTSFDDFLLEALYRTPNKTTLEAMKEAEDVENLETLDLDNFENYVASL